MPKLRDIQEQFARHLQGLPTSPDIAEQVQFNQLQNWQRLQVYQNNFKLSLTNNLAAIYPVIEKLVGEQFFKFAGHEFIKAHPSRQGNLHRYGREFSEFLSQFEPARSLPYLADMAQLEWAYHEVFHEASTRKLDLQALQKVHPQQYPQLVFHLHPATRLIYSEYPLTRIWQANQADDPEQINIVQKPRFFLVGRRNHDNIFQSLEKIDYDFLSMVQSSLPLEAITEQLQLQNADCEIDFNELLIKHVSIANICNFEISMEPQ